MQPDTCPDCKERNGQIRTIAEWLELGIPKSKHNRCGMFCKCPLQAVEYNEKTRLWVEVEPIFFGTGY
jgi:hypothetical protein